MPSYDMLHDTLCIIGQQYEGAAINLRIKNVQKVCQRYLDSNTISIKENVKHNNFVNVTVAYSDIKMPICKCFSILAYTKYLIICFSSTS